MKKDKSEKCSEKEEITYAYACELNWLYSNHKMDYSTYDELFDEGVALLDKMYEQGKEDSVIHAHWIVDKETFECTCSNCKNRVDIGDARDYCGYCGAKMDGKKSTIHKKK